MDPIPRHADEIVERLQGLGEIDPDRPDELRQRAEVLPGWRNTAMVAVEQATGRLLAEPTDALARVDDRLVQEEEKLERRRRDRRHKSEYATAWRAVGIQERVQAPDLSPAVRLVVFAVLASLDFYVFALAIARDQGVAAELTEPLFLVGGVVGLGVFGAGLMLARLIKGALYARAQARLRREIRSGEHSANGVPREQLVTSRPQYVQLAIVLAIFLLMAGYAFGIRWQAMGPSDDPNVVILQSLIPLLAVAVEVFLHDPSQVDAPRPSLRWRWYRRERARHEASVTEAENHGASERRRVNAMFDEAETTWQRQVEARLRGRRDRSREPGPTVAEGY